MKVKFRKNVPSKMRLSSLTLKKLEGGGCNRGSKAVTTTMEKKMVAKKKKKTAKKAKKR